MEKEDVDLVCDVFFMFSSLPWQVIYFVFIHLYYFTVILFALALALSLSLSYIYIYIYICHHQPWVE